MTLPKKFQKPQQHTWTTLDVRVTDNKLILEERKKHDAARYFAETALCVIVGVLLLGSYLLFILPEIHLLSAYRGVSLPVAMVGVALVLYAFATRGSKPQVGFDKIKNQIWMCKLNTKGRARIVTYFPKADVRSVFILRPNAPFKDAALLARIKGKADPVTLLRGGVDDIEAAHSEFCGALRDPGTVRPVRPVLKVNFRTPRPGRQLRTAAA
ncbi:hypothetical protein C1J03_05655 [Sulfitobacter sp. SK012]|uniref:hypothetical protein n=1 Tax=Sulfitobacter sp. SK012 TaxID=1389005 RepID=UPI000E0A2EB7|nr:hypothetical protein [Sulfitobacter sp. SK012]AXI45565.1 hypothetical protein C1J03_05655 [Sulfitobacter sp. SK012]